MITFTWIVEKLDCYPEEQGQKNVVFNVHWRCTGIETVQLEDGEKTYSGQSYGTSPVSSDDDFIPYELLTEETVLQWTWLTIDKVAIEESIVRSINSQKQPPVVSPPLPWNG